MKTRKSRTAVIVGVLVVLVAGAWGALAYVRRPRVTPALRGSQLAGELGCFACHGPGGTGGVPNPGSEVEDVPAWDGGNAMMYVQNEQEIREWILYGKPKRLQEEQGDESPGRSEAGRDRHHLDNDGDHLPIAMPAFEGVISSDDLEDLVAYYRAVAAFDTPPTRAKKGYRAASRLGCFGCHGPGGRVGSRNPRSFKGYIPPWHGRDFADLVKNEEELRQWILDGKIERLESNPLARYFMRRQLIQMPAYRGILDDGELEDLVAYIQWLDNQ
jgi:mono/diheme cytochrome c family protein